MIASVAVWAVLPGGIRAQSVDVGTSGEEYLRVLQLTGSPDLGSFTLRPAVFREEGPSLPARHPWMEHLTLGGWQSFTSVEVEPFEARWRFFMNSNVPTVQNDGAVWQGRGVTTALDLGTTVRWKGLRVAMKPLLIFAQNSYFELAPVGEPDQSEYAYPWRRIDLPQRFGPDSFWALDPGQSEIRVSGRGVTAGFGSRNMWWGPAVRSAMIMSNNAAGFPHAFVGTRGPRRVGIGSIEANWVYGHLSQSDWFDLPVSTDQRFLAGLVVTFNPDLLPGLSLGGTRVFYGASPGGGWNVSDALLVLQGITKRSQTGPGSPTGDDDKDQMLSLFGRWLLPASGFELYAEWARNDHSQDLTDFVLEPEHSQAYTVGLQKAVEVSEDRRMVLRVELTHLEREATFRVRPSPVYYAHHIVTQGYTHDGQVIGAGLGPGGSQQHLGGDFYAPWGRAGVIFQRRVFDNDAYYDWALANDGGFSNHHVALDAGVHATLFTAGVEVGGQWILTRELNRYFDGPNVWNLNLGLTASWRPR